METKLPWYKQPAIIILLLIFFFPVGLLLMWVNTNWNKKVKIAITGFFLFMVVVGSFSDPSENKVAESTKNAQPTPNVINNTEPTPTPSKEVKKSLGITYDQITKGFDKYIPEITRSDLRDGRERYLGSSKDSLSTLEIIGPKQDVESVSLLIFASKDALENVDSVIIFSNLLYNVFPNWKDSVTWTSKAIGKINKGTSDKEEIEIEGKVLKVAILKEMGLISLEIKPK